MKSFIFAFIFIVIYILLVIQAQEIGTMSRPLIEEHMNLAFRPDIQELGRADPDVQHTIGFGILQKNQDRLQQVLMEVSTPGNPNYGKHWTKEQLDELTRNQEGHDRVLAVLQSMPDVEIERETRNGGYIYAKAPIRVWENLFQTEFFVFKADHIHDSVIRCKVIHIPASMQGDVAIVLNTIELPTPPHKGPIITKGGGLGGRSHLVPGKRAGRGRGLNVIHGSHGSEESGSEGTEEVDEHQTDTA